MRYILSPGAVTPITDTPGAFFLSIASTTIDMSLVTQYTLKEMALILDHPNTIFVREEQRDTIYRNFEVLDAAGANLRSIVEIADTYSERGHMLLLHSMADVRGQLNVGILVLNAGEINSLFRTTIIDEMLKTL